MFVYKGNIITIKEGLYYWNKLYFEWIEQVFLYVDLYGGLDFKI